MEIPNVQIENNLNMVKSNTESEMTNSNIGNMGNNPDGVYVDLNCFMKNIQVLQNHTDNMMIDLSLLLSNIKSCSYIKKSKKVNVLNQSNSSNIDSNQIVNQITSKIYIPQPDIVKLQNLKANLLVSNSGNNTNSVKVLEVTKEPFESNSSNQSDWSYYDFIKVVILVIILIFLIFRK